MNDEKAKKIRDALAGWKTGQYQSVSACAEYFQVPRTTLCDMIVDPRTVHSWFELTKERLLNDPELSECWKDPRRIFNQDETPCVLALSMRRSLPLWATTDPSTTSVETPGHTPASAPSSPGTGSTSAVGLCIRVSATQQRRLPTFPRMASPAMSPEEYVSREVFQQGILADLVEHCETENIPKPVCIQCPV